MPASGLWSFFTVHLWPNEECLNVSTLNNTLRGFCSHTERDLLAYDSGLRFVGT